MRALVVPICENPYVADIQPGLKNLQKFLLGYIECVYLSDSAVLICNEEGKMLGFTPNRVYQDDIICGDFIIVGTSEDDFCDISEEDIKKYTNMFANPEVLFLRTDKGWVPVNAEDNGKVFLHYEIFQCKNDTPYLFYGLNLLQTKGYKLKQEDYSKVYHSITQNNDDILHICEQLYMEYNTIISDRRGHSMSVSDIIALHFCDKTRYFFVDSFGFVELEQED